MFEQRSYHFLTKRQEPKMAGPGDLQNMSVKVWGLSPTGICFQIEELRQLDARKKMVIQHHSVIWKLNWNKTNKTKYRFSNNQDNRIIQVEVWEGMWMSTLSTPIVSSQISTNTSFQRQNMTSHSYRR